MTTNIETPSAGDQTTNTRRGRPPRPKDQPRPHIKLPDGDEGWPFPDIANEFGTSVKWLDRHGLSSMLVAGVKYGSIRSARQIIADGLAKPKRKRRGRR